jgi:hypothetical protein
VQHSSDIISTFVSETSFYKSMINGYNYLLRCYFVERILVINHTARTVTVWAAEIFALPINNQPEGPMEHENTEKGFLQ